MRKVYPSVWPLVYSLEKKLQDLVSADLVEKALAFKGPGRPVPDEDDMS